jgi:PTS system mannose-specific IID component
MAEATNNQGVEGRMLSNKDVSKVTNRWIVSNTASWSYERMQNVGFAWSLMPALKKLYPNKDDFSVALTRHMAFFNTEMVIGSPILGAALAMEEQRAEGKDVPDDLIETMKTSLMGPFAALGDSLWGATINALLLSTCMGIAMGGNIAGPILYIVIWAAAVYGVSHWEVKLGYKQGTDIIDSPMFSEANVKKVTSILGILGLIMIGGLSAGFVSVSTPIAWTVGEATTQLQTILDGLMPRLLPFITVVVAYFFHAKKNVGIIPLLLGMVAVGAICALVGIL